jgi:hypothetical protein
MHLPFAPTEGRQLAIFGRGCEHGQTLPCHSETWGNMSNMSRNFLPLLMGATGALVIMVLPAPAAPGVGTLESLKGLGAVQGTEQVAASCYRRCWRSRGVRRCQRVCRRT